MDNMKNIIISVIAAAIVVVIGLTIVPRTTITQVGGSSGNTQTSHQYFLDNTTTGGLDFATTSQGTVTYTAASIVNARVIEHIASAATTGTLPTNAALSSLGFLPNVGDTQSFFIHASTTAITLAGNTGVTLVTASSTKLVAAGSIGRVECTRLGATEARLIWCILIAD